MPGDPIAAQLLARIRLELAADFAPSSPIHVGRAPGRLDVMGGIADYTGSLVCQLSLDRETAVAAQPRGDGQVQVFSFNRLADHQPFTLRMAVKSLAQAPIESLRREFAEPGRQWAAYLAGCLRVLFDAKLLSPDAVPGLNLAVLSSVPPGAGISSSAALEVATMRALRQAFGIAPADHEGAAADALRLAELCQRVENHVVGVPCGIMDQAACCLGEPGKLLRLICQPHQLLPPLPLPLGMQVVGIDSGVRRRVGDGAYARTRCAAFMGHKIILDRMRQLGAAAGRTLQGDPMGGWLANLDPDDYKRLFRLALPESMRGDEFLRRHGATIDPVTSVAPEQPYAVLGAVDHHVLEARRVRQFAEFLEAAIPLPPHSRERGRLLDKAGHLMYASHHSYMHDARLGDDACDLMVHLVRQREPAGLYGARITGGGAGGTVAVLAERSPRADDALTDLQLAYHHQTGLHPTRFNAAANLG